MPIASIERSTEYHLTPGAVKRQLARLKLSQREAARLTGLNPAMVSMVLNRRARSMPCLKKLTALIQARQESK